MASSTPKSGGYDCKFVDAPPDKLVCQICLLVSATSHQVTCCGRVYCQACLDEHKKRSRTCPNCRKRGQKFPDIRGEWTLDFSNIGTTYCRLVPRPLSKKSKGVARIAEVFVYDVRSRDSSAVQLRVLFWSLNRYGVISLPSRSFLRLSTSPPAINYTLAFILVAAMS